MCARLCGVVRDVRDVGGQVNAHQGFLCPCETLSEIAPDNTTIQRAWHARRGFRWVKRGGRAAPTGGGGGGGGRAETSRRNAREQKGWISSRHWNLANSRGMLRHTPAPSLCLRVYVSAVRGNAWRREPPFSQSQTSVSRLRDFHPRFFPLLLFTTYRSQPCVPRKSFHLQILESW